MNLTKRSVDMLIDLVEIKLSCIEVYDRRDRREIQRLRQVRDELKELSGAFPPRRRPGRRPAMEQSMAH